MHIPDATKLGFTQIISISVLPQLPPISVCAFSCSWSWFACHHLRSARLWGRGDPGIEIYGVSKTYKWWISHIYKSIITPNPMVVNMF